uniref:Phosphoglycerate mutase family protein, expressed n=3 Tax=Oryza sativa subsp. japonica TaxID=39947 RepID=Q2RAT6_ORYSJ|nr:phosphoglycerate mutase family protein, expressed [Oryza sativa Japonica Group]
MATPARFSTKPHVFDGTDFSHWCSRMKSYIMVEDYDIWRKVSHPYVIPEAINTAAEKTALEQNCKARNILLSGISRSDYDRVAHLQTAHEIWIALSNFHQGTNNIKELRRDLFKKEYIKFEMKPGEALDDYLSRFNKTLSNLRSVDSFYDANYPQSEISRHFLNGLDMSIWDMKVTSIQESVNMSTLTLDSLYTKLKTHEMNILARKFEEEDLVLLSNKSSRAMKNVRNKKRGKPNRCFECGALDHLRSHCPKLERGKKEDDGRVKDDDVNKKKNMKEKEKKNHCMQWLIQEIIKAFDESEDEDESKGKQVVDTAFIARNASSDVDESDDDNEEKLSYDQLEYAAYKFAKKLQTCSIVLDEKDNTIEILNAEIARLKSLIPNDDNCQSCEVLFSEINALRDVYSVNCKKLEFEIEKSKKLESSFALGFALHARVVDELILTNNEVSYLKSSLQRFSEGKKNLNMILDQSKKKEREITFAKRRWQKSGFNLRTTVRPALTSRSDRPAVRPQLNRRSDRLPGPVRPQVQQWSDRPRGNFSRNSNQAFVKRQDDSMPRESICGDGPGVGLVSNRQLTGGQTGGTAAVRPAGTRRSDRRRQESAAGNLGGSTDRSTSVRPTFIKRSDRRNNFGGRTRGRMCLENLPWGSCSGLDVPRAPLAGGCTQGWTYPEHHPRWLRSGANVLRHNLRERSNFNAEVFALGRCGPLRSDGNRSRLATTGSVSVYFRLYEELIAGHMRGTVRPRIQAAGPAGRRWLRLAATLRPISPATAAVRYPLFPLACGRGGQVPAVTMAKEVDRFVELVVVRHGETSWNASRIVQGQMDPELNEIGKQQAVVVARRLAREARPAAIYSSDLKRAAETAEIIAKACDVSNLMLTEALRERHMGYLQGLMWDDAVNKSPSVFKGFANFEVKNGLDFDDRNHELPGGGESLNQLSERCISYLNKVAQNHIGERVIVVGHGAAILELCRHTDPPNRSIRRKIPNTSLNIFRISGVTGRWILERCGDVGHLSENGFLENVFGGDGASA